MSSRSLPAVDNENRSQHPIKAYGRLILLNSQLRNAPEGTDPEFRWSTLDPITGQVSPAWSGEPYLFDRVSDGDGDWLVTVRNGLSLPFPDWSIILRNPTTGETRTIAEDDPRVIQTPGLNPKLPFGFAPDPSMSAGKVVWNAIEIDDSGEPRDRVMLYDLATEQQTTLYEADPRVEEVYSPTIGAGHVAWVRHASPDAPYEIIVRDLQGGTERVIEDVGGPYSAALSEDGRYLAWDDGMVAKWALNLETGERVQYAADEGWGTYVSGHYVSWAVKNTGDGKGGFYDFETKTVRFVEREPRTVMNVAFVMGDWFVWQVLPPGDLDHGVYYFMPLGNGP